MVLVLTYIFPSIGVITSNALFLSPLKEILELRRPQSTLIYSNNCIPYVTMSGTTSAWCITLALILVFYSFLLPTTNHFVFWANVIGYCLSIFYTASMYGIWYAEKKSISLENSKLGSLWCKRILSIWISSSSTVWLVAYIAFLQEKREDGHRIMGTACLVLMILFIVSPLSFIWKNTSSATISVPLASTILLNSSVWFAYGLALSDIFVVIPNAIAILLAIIQLFLTAFLRFKIIAKTESQVDLMIELEKSRDFSTVLMEENYDVAEPVGKDLMIALEESRDLTIAVESKIIAKTEGQVDLMIELEESRDFSTVLMEENYDVAEPVGKELI